MMNDQNKDQNNENPGNQSDKQNQATQNPGQNKQEHEGAFSHQSGKEIPHPQKKDVQTSDQDSEQKNGTNP